MWFVFGSRPDFMAVRVVVPGTWAFTTEWESIGSLIHAFFTLVATFGVLVTGLGVVCLVGFIAAFFLLLFHVFLGLGLFQRKLDILSDRP